MSVYVPEEETAVIQCLIRERVPSVPAVLDALRETDWQMVRETHAAIAEDCANRVIEQMGTLESYLDAKGAVPSVPDRGDGNGSGA